MNVCVGGLKAWGRGEAGQGVWGLKAWGRGDEDVGGEYRSCLVYTWIWWIWIQPLICTWLTWIWIQHLIRS